MYGNSPLWEAPVTSLIISISLHVCSPGRLYASHFCMLLYVHGVYHLNWTTCVLESCVTKAVRLWQTVFEKNWEKTLESDKYFHAHRQILDLDSLNCSTVVVMAICGTARCLTTATKAKLLLPFVCLYRSITHRGNKSKIKFTLYFLVNALI